MRHWFELWDAQSASLVGTYDTQAAALVVVRRSLASFGPASVASLVLTAEKSGGADPRVIAAGDDLAALAGGRRRRWPEWGRQRPSPVVDGRIAAWARCHVRGQPHQNLPLSRWLGRDGRPARRALGHGEGRLVPILAVPTP